MSQQAPAPTTQIKWFPIASLFSYIIATLVAIGVFVMFVSAGFSMMLLALAFGAFYLLGQAILFAIYGTQE